MQPRQLINMKNKQVSLDGQFITINGEWYVIVKMSAPVHLPKLKPLFEVKGKFSVKK